MSNINNLVESILASSEIENLRPRVEVIIKKKDKILITIIPPFPPAVIEHYYGLPGGGIEKNQNEISAVRNEAREEVGIQVTNIKKVNVKPFVSYFDQLKYSSKFNDTKLDSRSQIYIGNTTNYFQADYLRDDTSVFGRDHDSLKYIWVTPKEAISLFKDIIKRNVNPKQNNIFNARIKAISNIILD